MAVSIDTVYQRVLAILNKEQRGYVTPQQFNLFANQAQLDIFEQYFYDINQFGRVPGNDTEFSDMLNILNEKISIFEVNDDMTYANNYWSPPADIYRMGTIVYKNTTEGFTLNPSATTTIETLVEAERIEYNDFLYINQSAYTRPTNTRPIFIENSSGYKVYGATELTSDVTCNYIKKPAEAVWGYQIVYGEALYDATTATNFELHDSEETELVVKILEFAGLNVEDVQMYQIANSMEQETNQQEKA